MAAVQTISIVEHTTASSPYPHVLYIVRADFGNGQRYEVPRRYSQFVDLQNYLGDSFALPPKRVVTNAFVPLAWLDDSLIAERKAGLEEYLNLLKAAPQYRINNAFLEFLSSPSFDVASLPDIKAPLMISQTTASLGLIVGPKATNIAAAYYPTWSAWSNPPDKVKFGKFDVLFFAFALPNASSTLDWDTGSQGILKKLVSSARHSGEATKIVLSVGGWGGSHWFSDVASNAANRTKFVKTLTSVVNSFGLDGIDIDWEYPGSNGAGNKHNPADSTNFLLLLKLLRSSLGPSKIISAAVAHLPWLGSNGKPLTNVSEFAAVMTYVNIMNYDVNGASSKPGPNAPLGDMCGSSTNPKANAQAAFEQWTKAGFPASKLLLGLPLYGYVSKSTATKLSSSNTRDLSAKPPGHPHGPPKELPLAPAGDLSAMWGQQIAFKQLVHSGVLERKGDGTYAATHGYTQGWDDCSDTPFLYNIARTTVVTYDDTWSIASKVKFAKSAGMGGCFTWSVDQDDDLALHDIICKNLGRL